MNVYLRSAVLGSAAAGLAFAAGAMLSFFYLEWLWFNDDGPFKTMTNMLVATWVLIGAATAYGAARLFEARLLVAVPVTAALLVPIGILALVVISHNNSCWGGESYPVPDQWVLWGRECGR